MGACACATSSSTYAVRHSSCDRIGQPDRPSAPGSPSPQPSYGLLERLPGQQCGCPRPDPGGPRIRVLDQTPGGSQQFLRGHGALARILSTSARVPWISWPGSPV